ncbi:unnamed protein product, partial [Allacma fusca]
PTIIVFFGIKNPLNSTSCIASWKSPKGPMEDLRSVSFITACAYGIFDSSPRYRQSHSNDIDVES